MSERIMTVREAVENARFHGPHSHDIFVESFLEKASIKELQEFIKDLPKIDSRWFVLANLIITIRLSEDAAKTAKELIEHTEKLTQQTDTQIQNSQTLSYQTAILVNESKSLTKFTKVLIGLTVALLISAVVQLIRDWSKHN